MEYRKLGSTDILVSEIGFGCNALGKSIFNSKSEKENIVLLHKAIDSGINFFDCAPTYSYGSAEITLGKAIKGKRKDLIITSKVGRLGSSLSKYARLVKPFSSIVKPALSPFRKNLKKASKKRFDFSSSHVRKTLLESLNRLNTDYLDIVQLHNPSLEVIQNGSIFDTLEKFKEEGIIRYYGVSIRTIEEATACLQYPINTIQLPFNLIQQNLAISLFDIDRCKDVGIMVNTPLLRGLLTSKNYLKEEYFDEETIKKIRQKKKLLDEMSKNKKMNHLALQYILKHENVSTVLCGTTSVKNLVDNIEYSVSGPILDKEWESINQIHRTYPL